jgi:non-ribosomal peptide synthetase component F
MSDTDKGKRLVWTGFLRSCEKFPNRPAVEVAGSWLSYKQLDQRARRLAATIQANTTVGVPTAVFAYRCIPPMRLCRTLMACHGYVLLNRTPDDRTRLMIEKSSCRSLIADEGSEAQLSEYRTASRRHW